MAILTANNSSKKACCLPKQSRCCSESFAGSPLGASGDALSAFLASHQRRSGLAYAIFPKVRWHIC